VWYIILYTVFAIWVFIDALGRKAKSVPWAIGTFFLGPVILPIYIAKRPLKSGEIREGGTAWNILKNFAIFWTILMAVAFIWGMVATSVNIPMLQSEAEKAGFAIGTTIGLTMIGALWFFPFTATVVLGLILKKSSIIEKGPAEQFIPETAQEKKEQKITAKSKLFSFGEWAFIIIFAIIVFGFTAYKINTNYVKKPKTQNFTSTESTIPKTKSKDIYENGLSLVDFKWERGEYDIRYLTGIVENKSNKTYSYVQVEFNLYDENDFQVGSTLDNINNFEPNGKWKFKAVVFEAEARKARLKGITGF